MVKLNLLDHTVSPPDKRILYFFCSCFKDLEIFIKFDGEKDLSFPDPEIK